MTRETKSKCTSDDKSNVFFRGVYTLMRARMQTQYLLFFHQRANDSPFFLKETKGWKKSERAGAQRTVDTGALALINLLCMKILAIGRRGTPPLPNRSLHFSNISFFSTRDQNLFFYSSILIARDQLPSKSRARSPFPSHTRMWHNNNTLTLSSPQNNA